MTPRSIADRQLELYNARDLDGFCALFAPDAVLTDLPSGTVLASGATAIRAMYADRFANPDLHCRVHGHNDIGSMAIDRETVEGLQGGPVDILAIYRVENDLIQAVWFIREAAR